MSILRVVKVWLGLSNTPANNFTIDSSADNGTMKLSRGNAGATPADIITINTDNTITAFMPLGFTNLKLSATGISASVLVTADTLTVVNSTSNMARLLRNVNVTINTAGSGANGLDTGTIAASTWYAVFIIAKDDGTVTGLISTSATAPILPTGYTHFVRVGWIRTDGSGNKYPLSFVQFGRRVQYKLVTGSNLTVYPSMATGTAGSVSTPPTWVAIAVANFVPTTAAMIRVMANNVTGSSGVIIASPNNTPSGSNSAANPPIIDTNAPTANVITTRGYAEMSLESSNIYWASSGASNGLFCLGWEDNL